MGGFAWVTLATNDSYSLGALVLAHSLKQAGTAHQLAVLVTPGVTNAMRDKLASVFNVVQEVNVLDSRDEANLRLLKRPELGVTFTKLHCWRLTQFEKCVFLDADTLVLQNCDELFEREELSAAPDVGWPDCFNSGVFVYRPSLDTYDKLIQFALEKGSFDGGDQGLLNLYFSDWAHKDISKHLPFIYNMCSTACYSYLPAFKQFGANAKIIHFIGATKPWLQYFNTETRKVQPSGDASHLQEVLQRWWDIFCSLIHPHLSPAMAGLAGAFAQLTLGVPRTAEQDALENLLRKQAWEVGNIDYLGKDSFDNIWSKITETLNSGAPPPAPVSEPTAPSAPAESQSQSAPQQEEAQPINTISSTDKPQLTAESVSSDESTALPSSKEPSIKKAEEPPKVVPEVEPLVCPRPQKEPLAEPVKTVEAEPAEACSLPQQKQTKLEESQPKSDQTKVEEPPLVCPRPQKTTAAAPTESKAKPEAVAPFKPAPAPKETTAAKKPVAVAQASKPPSTEPPKPTLSRVSKEPAKVAAPKTKVTEATPPATPSSPPVEKAKEALAAESSIPETPPPTEESSGPSPPPRKTDKQKKVVAKPKK